VSTLTLSKKAPSNGYLRIAQIIELIPISKPTVWRWVRDGKFPAPIKLSHGVTVWKNQDVQAWLDLQNGGAV
jgi:prophage regulatory protein